MNPDVVRRMKERAVVRVKNQLKGILVREALVGQEKFAKYMEAVHDQSSTLPSDLPLNERYEKLHAGMSQYWMYGALGGVDLATSAHSLGDHAEQHKALLQQLLGRFEDAKAQQWCKKIGEVTVMMDKQAIDVFE